MVQTIRTPFVASALDRVVRSRLGDDTIPYKKVVFLVPLASLGAPPMSGGILILPLLGKAP